MADPFIGERSESSAEFGRRWDELQVRSKPHAVKRFQHRQVGEVSLEYQAVDFPKAAGWQFIVYDAEPGTTSAEVLVLLGPTTAF